MELCAPHIAISHVMLRSSNCAVSVQVGCLEVVDGSGFVVNVRGLHNDLSCCV